MSLPSVKSQAGQPSATKAAKATRPCAKLSPPKNDNRAGSSSTAAPQDRVTLGEPVSQEMSGKELGKMAMANRANKPAPEVEPVADISPSATATAPATEVATATSPATEVASAVDETPAEAVEARKPQAPKVEEPSTQSSNERWGKVDRGLKQGSGGLNLWGGFRDFSQGNFAEGSLKTATGLTELGSARVEALQVSSGAACPQLSQWGNITKFGGAALGAASIVLSLKEAKQAYDRKDTIKAAEKTADSLASGVGLAATLGDTGALLEAGLAGSTGAGLAMCAVAFATGWGVGRTLGSATPIDGLVEDFAKSHVFNDGQRALDRIDGLSSGAASFTATLDNPGLQRYAGLDSQGFARAITGNLTSIEKANAAKDDAKERMDSRAYARAQADLKSAQAELQRLRLAQHGELMG